MSSCPKCRMDIDHYATVCPYCHSEIESGASQVNKLNNITEIIVVGLILIVVLFLLPSFLLYYISLIIHVNPWPGNGEFKVVLSTFLHSINIWTVIGCGTFWAVVLWWLFLKIRKVNLA